MYLINFFRNTLSIALTSLSSRIVTEIGPINNSVMSLRIKSGYLEVLI